MIDNQPILIPFTVLKLPQLSHSVQFWRLTKLDAKSGNERPSELQEEDGERPRAAADERGERGVRQIEGVDPAPQAQPGTLFSDVVRFT